MAQKVGEIYYDVTLETGEMIRGQREVQRTLDSSSSSLDGFGGKLTQVARAVGLYASALYLVERSDAFTKMNAQLKLATESTRELAVAQADVKRIAQEAQTDIGAVATLYARITNATKELGIGQKAAGDITRTVALALKVSGATAAEASSAMLQLSQAFGSGVLRGEEFNAVNEAAPRLMKALADGIGIPIGQLKVLAADGKLTSDVLATALPKALKDLEGEARQIQTISGAFQELKNEVMLFVGEQAAASGAVQVVTGAIGALTNSLGLLAGVMATVAAVKLALWLESIVVQAYSSVAANSALRASTLAAAQAHATATGATATLTAARVAELRASVLAAEGNVALSITTNGLIPAQARAAAAAQAHTTALAALTIAQRASSAGGMAAAGVMGVLGGPIGLVTTLLGLGATAWMLWGDSAKDESQKAANAIEVSSREIISSLDKQNAKLRERLQLAKGGQADAAKAGGPAAEKLASMLTKINTLKSKGAEITMSERMQLLEYEGQYQSITRSLAENARLTGEVSDIGQKSKAGQWMDKYATDAERVNAEIGKAKKELGTAFTPELEQRIREKIIPAKKGGGRGAGKDRLDDTGYLAGLRKATADGLDEISMLEQKALADNTKRLTDKQISEATHQEAVTLIQADFEQRRMDYRLAKMREVNAEAETIRQQDIAAETAAFQKEQELKRQRESVQLGTLAMKAEGGGAQDKENYVIAKAQADMASVEALRLLDLENSQIYADQKVAIEAKMQQDIADLRAAANSAAYSSQADIFGSLASIAKDAAGEQSGIYKAMFAASKAFAIADAIVKIQAGIANAAAMPWPLNLGAMASVAAATAGIVSTISGTSMAGGRQYGGPVSADSLYRVNEKGAPEMFTAGNGQQYMLPTQSGRVTAADQVGAGAVQWNIIVNNSAPGVGVTASVDDQSKTVTLAVGEVANQIRANSGPVWSALRSSSNVAGRI